MENTIVTSVAVFFSLLATKWLHAEGLGFIRLEIVRHSVSERLRLVIIVCSAILLHVIEIGYAIIIGSACPFPDAPW